MKNIAVIVIALILIILSKIFIAAWVYKDAKSRGLNPYLWMILIIFSSGSLAFLLYILIIRDKRTVVCEKCNFIQSDKLSYCGRCGNKITIDDYSRKNIEGDNNTLLILGIVFLIIALVFITIFTIKSIGGKEIQPSASIMSVSNKYGNKWKDSFKYKNGEWSHNFKVDKKTVLNSSWNIEDGYIEAKLYKDNEVIKEINSKDNPSYSELIDLSQYKGDKVVLRIEFTKASGRIDFHLE